MVDDFIIIAHRGASALWPENTLLAFHKALEAGAPWIELDVHLSADNNLVVIHDEYLERTTSGRGLVAQQSLAKLRELNAGLGEKIPLLSEVLELAAGRAQINIELKGVGTAEPVALLLDQLFESGRLQERDLLVSSLNEDELTFFAKFLQRVPLAPIADVPDAGFWALADRLKAWSVNLEKDSISKALVEKNRQQGRKTLVYTVNDQATLTTLKGLGIDGVFTDVPELFLKNR